MLVLTLKPNKHVTIELETEEGGENEYIGTIRVLEVIPGRVKLGFEGDSDVIFIRSDAKYKQRHVEPARNLPA